MRDFDPNVDVRLSAPCASPSLPWRGLIYALRLLLGKRGKVVVVHQGPANRLGGGCLLP